MSATTATAATAAAAAAAGTDSQEECGHGRRSYIARGAGSVRAATGEQRESTGNGIFRGNGCGNSYGVVVMVAVTVAAVTELWLRLRYQ